MCVGQPSGFSRSGQGIAPARGSCVPPRRGSWQSVRPHRCFDEDRASQGSAPYSGQGCEMGRLEHARASLLDQRSLQRAPRKYRSRRAYDAREKRGPDNRRPQALDRTARLLLLAASRPRAGGPRRKPKRPSGVTQHRRVRRAEYTSQCIRALGRIMATKTQAGPRADTEIFFFASQPTSRHLENSPPRNSKSI